MAVTSSKARDLSRSLSGAFLLGVKFRVGYWSESLRDIVKVPSESRYKIPKKSTFIPSQMFCFVLSGKCLPAIRPLLKEILDR